MLLYSAMLADTVLESLLFQASRLESLLAIFPSPHELVALLAQKLVNNP